MKAMEAVKLEAQVRANTGKTYARQIRKEGRVPAILYGKEIESKPIEVSAKDLEKLLVTHGVNALVKLQVAGEGEEHATLIREVQRHPVRGDIYHVDFYKISLKDKLHTVVPIQLTGEPEGVRDGGILQYGIKEVEVECLPTNIPEYFEADISGLKIGDTFTVGDLESPEGVEILSEESSIIATVVPPRLGADKAKAEETTEDAEEVSTEESPEEEDTE